ncbi:hypothetical protein KSD_06020 [Ktedonobacter sp. SOSP1-85]|uniref:hypothetical protein n=1 Tax=Ktedonobacter sp. SOSP1-85 TaxID=2778367 RepID=UPI0019159E2F|nr:hypothetical protein [Ktedonobacter sp. SOSP1-85]GHO72831.1 hypothetical protein KSD_06020 [Ktedonobacter sp. SOSP1-85]
MPTYLFCFLQYLAWPEEYCFDKLRGLPTDHQEIYRLYDPRTQATHYIGRAKDSQERLRYHIKESVKYARRGWLSPTTTGKTYVSNPLKRIWILELISQGLRPQAEELEVVDPPSYAPLRELRWLLHYCQEGARLYNYETVQPDSRVLPLVRHYAGDLLHEAPGVPIWDTLARAARGESI